MEAGVEKDHILFDSLVFEVQVVDREVLIDPVELLETTPIFRFLLHQICEGEPLVLNLLLIDDFLL